MENESQEILESEKDSQEVTEAENEPQEMVEENNEPREMTEGNSESPEKNEPAKEPKKDNSMRIALIILLVVVMLFAAFIIGKNIGAKEQVAAYQEALEAQMAEMQEAPAAESTESEAPAEPTPEPAKIELDFDKLYALHAPEDVVMAIGGKDVTWGEYFYCLYNQAGRISSTLQQMAMYYGMNASWDDVADAEGTETVGELAVSNSVEMLKQMKAVSDYAEEKKLSLSEEDEEAMKKDIDEQFVKLLGEEASEEKINETLSKMYLTREQFEEINRNSKLFAIGYDKQYGKNARKVSTAKAVKYLEDNGYLAASHILFMTVDAATREPLEETAAAEKKALAEETLAKLKAVEDKDEKIALFKEMKEQYCEDTGKVAYPDGYLFTPGTMVPEFENAVTAMGEYEISELVESTYGYHIIMRLPLNADMVIDKDSSGADITARTAVADKEYSDVIQKRMDDMTVEYKNGYEAPKLSEFTK